MKFTTVVTAAASGLLMSSLAFAGPDWYIIEKARAQARAAEMQKRSNTQTNQTVQTCQDATGKTGQSEGKATH